MLRSHHTTRPTCHVHALSMSSRPTGGVVDLPPTSLSSHLAHHTCARHVLPVLGTTQHSDHRNVCPPGLPFSLVHTMCSGRLYLKAEECTIQLFPVPQVSVQNGLALSHSSRRLTLTIQAADGPCKVRVAKHGLHWDGLAIGPGRGVGGIRHRSRLPSSSVVAAIAQTKPAVHAVTPNQLPCQRSIAVSVAGA